MKYLAETGKSKKYSIDLYEFANDIKNQASSLLQDGNNGDAASIITVQPFISYSGYMNTIMDDVRKGDMSSAKARCYFCIKYASHAHYDEPLQIDISSQEDLLKLRDCIDDVLGNIQTSFEKLEETAKFVNEQPAA